MIASAVATFSTAARSSGESETGYRGLGDLHRERGKLQALPIATPIDSTIAPPSVTTSSEERSETCRNCVAPRMGE